MSIKSLGFDKISAKARGLRKTLDSHKPEQSFSIDPEAEEFLVENPLAPIVGTICDEQIRAEYAWEFPYWLSKRIIPKKFISEAILALGVDGVRALLQEYMGDKWPPGMNQEKRDSYLNNTSKRIADLCEYLEQKYQGNADQLFQRGGYSVPEVYFILRTLPGIGPKKASMIARDLVKGEGTWYEGLSNRLGQQGIKLGISGEHMSEMPVDIHVVKVFGRVMGEFRRTPEMIKIAGYWPDIQNLAKLVVPEFPGRLDELFWTVGRTYCDEHQPNCASCPLQKIPCEYVKQSLSDAIR